MNLRDLQYLIALAELNSFSQAADRCCVSQPTLSNQIRKLEDTLGVTLFERNNKRVMITDVGEQMVVHARRILAEVDGMQELAQLSHDPLAGRLRLGAFPTLSSYWFPSLVPRISAALPRIKLVLVEEKTQVLIERLNRGELDAAFLALPVQDDKLVEHPLFHDTFMLAVPPDHRFAALPRMTQQALAGESLLLLEEGHCLRDQALDICHRVGMSEAQDVRATSLETLRQMVKAGTGITLMPRIAISPDETGICYIPVEPAPQRHIGLVWRKTTARQALLDVLVSITSDTVAIR